MVPARPNPPARSTPCPEGGRIPGTGWLTRSNTALECPVSDVEIMSYMNVGVLRDPTPTCIFSGVAWGQTRGHRHGSDHGSEGKGTHGARHVLGR